MALMFAALLMMGCVQKHRVQHSPSPSDTLYTESKALDMYGQNPQRALAIVDSAEFVGSLSQSRADMLRIKIMSETLEGNHLDSAIVLGEQLLLCQEATTDKAFRQDVLEALISASRLKENYELYLRTSTELADLCREQGLTTEALRNEAEVGLALTHLGQQEKGLAKIDGVMQALADKRHFNELDAYIVAAKRKYNILSGDARYAEAIDPCERIIGALNDYEQHPSDYHDGTYREPSDEDRPGYIDFYRMQTYGFLANIHAHLHNKTAARHYLSLYNQSPFAKTFDSRKSIATTLCLLGDYAAMEAIYKDVERHLGSDTINAYYASMLLNRTQAALAQGRSAEAFRLHKRYDVVQDSIHERILVSKAHDYAARYHAQELQMALQKESAAKSRSTLMNIIISFAFCCALAFLFYFFHQRRLLKHKNRILVRQITEAMKYKEMYRNLPQVLSTEGNHETASVPAEEPAHPVLTEVDTTPQMTHEEGTAEEASALFHRLSKVITDEQLFLDPTFDRQAAMERFHLSKERIGTAFAQGSDYASLAAFITACRLEYATRLLREQPTLTISQVATASGFSSTNHFGRAFKSTYGLSPTEYRAAKVG